MRITSRSSDDKMWIVCDMPDDGSPRYFLYSRADKSTVLICVCVCVCVCVCARMYAWYDVFMIDLSCSLSLSFSLSLVCVFGCVFVCDDNVGHRAVHTQTQKKILHKKKY
jgi:hypothetical protein